MNLVWNAIVKNEQAIIDRCVNSLLPHIDGAVIVDTGSTDDTVAHLKYMFAKALVPLDLHQVPFENFSQARNAALQAARDSKMPWDYLLLADADMELKVHRPNWINGAKGLSYDLKQTAGALGYYNRRLVSRRATGWYVGCTHEYLDVPSDGSLDGAEFIDHADGANRPDKFSRDIALLEKALETETNPGLIQRYHFYLANTFFDMGEFGHAAEHYKLRMTLGGFEEEVWYAHMRYAMCCRQMGDHIGFLREMMAAYQRRPSRAETLYELARFFRERGDNHTSLLFSEPRMQAGIPKDLLFVNNWIYNNGLREEFAICAYYDLAKRQRGREVCNKLALAGSDQARANQYWYLQPLSELLTTFKPKRIPVTAIDGYVPMNPSVINYKGKPLVLVRTVNYTITSEGVYAIRGSDGSRNRDNCIDTINHLVFLDDKLNYVNSERLALPPEWPEPKYRMVRGFEDSRLFEFEDRLWTSSTVRELTEEGYCQQVVCPLAVGGYANDWTVFESHQNTHEKNWMPWVKDGEIQFVYRLGSLIKLGGGHGFHQDPGIDVSGISGGSQVCDAGGVYIALVHEARHIPGRLYNRYYQHRFVVFANDGRLLRISAPFVFHDRQIEFAAGLAYFPENRQLMVSYGVRDCEAWLATMDLDEVIAFIAEGS